MQIVITTNSPPRLDQAGDLKRFSIALDPVLRPDLKRALSPVGDLDEGEEHVWVRPDAVRAISPLAGDPEWEDGFKTMLAFADQHGWMKDGRFRAHLEDLAWPESVSAETFRQAMRKYASGVCIVAAGEGESRSGMTVSAFASVSAEPPQILVCINRAAGAHDHLTKAGTFSVNMLSAGQEDVAMLFAGAKGIRGAERFQHSDWQQGEFGVPELIDAQQVLICAAETRHISGSHTVLIGRVINATVESDKAALINYDGRLHRTSRSVPCVSGVNKAS